jgi:hypothetical protein
MLHFWDRWTCGRPVAGAIIEEVAKVKRSTTRVLDVLQVLECDSAGNAVVMWLRWR